MIKIRNEHKIIILISEGSCETEDWSNLALITGIYYILTPIDIYEIFKIVIMLHNSTYFCLH